MKNSRVPVFLCYAYDDQEFHDKLIKFLAPFKMQDQVCAWSDAEIQAGSDWNSEIGASIGNAKVAVLLISHSFLASDYIRNSEVPRLLAERESSGLRILPLILKPCPYELAEFRFPDPSSGPESLSISSIQSVNPHNTPLTMLDEATQDEVFTQLARTLHSIWQGGR